MELYKDINSMPITVFMKFQKYVMIEQGLGSNVQDFSTRLSKMGEYISHNRKDNALEELKNVFNLFYSIVEKEQDVKLYAIAVLIKGNEQLGDEEIKDYVSKNLLNKTVEEIYKTYFELKKKLLSVSL